jgi:uncharacterized membrane protein
MRIIESIQAKAQQAAAAALALSAAIPHLALAQGFDKINTTVTNINTILVTISMLIGGTLVGGAAAFASYIVT